MTEPWVCPACRAGNHGDCEHALMDWKQDVIYVLRCECPFAPAT